MENGSFDVFEGGKFAAWTIGPKANAEGVSKLGTVSQVSLDSASGGSAASFGFLTAGRYGVGLTKRVAVDPARKYVLSLRAMAGETPVEVKATIRLIGGKEASAEKIKPRDLPLEFKAGKEWETKTLDLETAPNEQFLMLHIILKSDTKTHATLLLDEVSVAPPQE